jgi:hypothetical protein
MRAEPWLDETRHGINDAISFGCDYCATTRRKRDVACWAQGRHHGRSALMSAAKGKADMTVAARYVGE